jgi:xylan 1,4-beta-xylosidase
MQLQRLLSVLFAALLSVSCGLTAFASGQSALTDVISIDAAAPAHPLPHFWEQAFGSGRAVLTLREGYRQDLRAVREATDFRYVRFHEILQDDLGVYDEDADGNPIFNFTLIDQIYDGLLAVSVRPIVELSFMPKKLAARLDLHPFWDKPVVAPPKDYARWDALIYALGAHLVERYGLEEVSQWYFEVWNEPNIDFWTGEPKLLTYLDLYEHTARALKAADPRLRVGGPATAAAHWIAEFLSYAAAHDVPVDFVSTHGYADDSAEDLFGTAAPVPVDERVCRAVAKVRNEIDSSATPGLPLFWTEWNVASFGDAAKARDTAYVGSGVAQTISQCDGLVQMLAYWTLSDVFDENGPPKRPFTGSFGLLGVGGIRKPSWTAFALLHRLGDERLDNPSPGTLVTRRRDGSLAIVVWNLRDPGTPQTNRDVALTLPTMAAQRGAISTIIDDEAGSSRDAYIAMGSPRYPSQRQIAELNRRAELPRPQDLKADADGLYRLHLKANALALIEIPPPGAAETAPP